MATKTQLYGDLTLPAAIWSAGAFTHGVVRSSCLHLAATYTQTAAPTDVSVGTPLLISWNPTLNDTNAVSQTSFFGPRGLIQVEGTVTYGANSGFLQLAPVGYAEQIIIKNSPGVARSIVGTWGFVANRIWEADGATVTLRNTDVGTGYTSFIDNAVYFTKNSGTIDGLTNTFTHVGFLSAPAILGNTTLSRIAMQIDDFSTGAGQVTIIGGESWGTGADTDAHSVPRNIGLQIAPLVNGTTNIGILSQSSVIVSDGTDSHGSTLINAGLPFGIQVSGVSVRKNATDTKPVAELLSNDGAGYLAFGPGGSTDPDVIFQRTASAAASITGAVTFASNMANTSGSLVMTDGTNGHGRTELTLTSNGPAVNLFTNANAGTDTKAVVGLSELAGLVFGVGGTTNPDVSLARTGTGAATYTATSLILNTGVSGTAIDTDSTFATGATTTVTASSAVKTALALKAPLASPTFTGTPAAPTAAQGTNTTQLATTAMVRSEAVLLAPLASPTLTGTPSASGGSLAITNASSESNLNITDGTAAHGKLNASAGALGPSFNIFGNSADTTVRAALLVNQLQFGPGGAAAVDVRLQRTGVGTATVTGVLTMTSPVLVTPAIGVATGTSLAVTGLLTSSSPTAGVGYATGAGGTVTQATSRTTTVVLNTLAGTITLFSTTLAADTDVSFTWTNSAIAATDVVVTDIKSGAAVKGGYSVNVICGAGTATVTVHNHTPTITATEAPVISFVVIKGVTS